MAKATPVHSAPAEAPVEAPKAEPTVAELLAQIEALKKAAAAAPAVAEVKPAPVEPVSFDKQIERAELIGCKAAFVVHAPEGSAAKPALRVDH